MKKEEILAMEAGEKLDALVLKEVMGEEGQFYWRGHPDYGAAPIKYSTDISAAWQVVEKMKTISLAIAYCLNWGKEYVWRVDFGLGMVEAKAFPEAICKAALLVSLRRERGDRARPAD